MKKIISVLIIAVVVGLILFLYVRNNPPVITNHTITTPPKTQNQLIEYKSPYGFSFQYPSEFRFARTFIKFLDSSTYGYGIDNKDRSLLLSKATEQEEETVIAASKKSTPFTPFESVDKGYLFTSKNAIRIDVKIFGFSFSEFKKKVEEMNKNSSLRFIITNLEEVTAGDGTRGYRYDINSQYGTGDRLFIFHLKKSLLFGIPPGKSVVTIYSDIRSSDDVNSAISQIISHLKFE